MDRKFYAISYEETGAILSYCQLEQRDLSAKGAVAALLDELIAEKLTLSLRLPGRDPIAIEKTHLRLDEVEVDKTKLDAFTRAPYTFILDLAEGAKPGDGKSKTVSQPAATYTPTLSIGSPGALVLTFTNALQSGTQFFAIIDGNAFSTTVANPTTTVSFQYTVLANSQHSVLFAGRGVKPTFQVMKA